MKKDEANEDAASTEYQASSGDSFPRLWEAPPVRQLRDLVKLPCNLGRGSSTMKNWIQRHMADDEECGAVYDREDGTCSLETDSGIDDRTPKAVDA